MTEPLISHGERAWWQRRAAAELSAILDAHQDPPRIAWTVGPAGSVLVGQVNGLAPAGRIREVFTAWRLALVLEDHREHQLGGRTVWLHAAARRHGVTVRLTATVFGDEGEEQ